MSYYIFNHEFEIIETDLNTAARFSEKLSKSLCSGPPRFKFIILEQSRRNKCVELSFYLTQNCWIIAYYQYNGAIYPPSYTERNIYTFEEAISEYEEAVKKFNVGQPNIPTMETLRNRFFPPQLPKSQYIYAV